MGLAVFGSALLIAFLAVIFRCEFEAWLPWLAERLRRLAVKQLHGAIRERLDEEWEAYLTEVPGYLGKLASAGGFLITSWRISLAATIRKSAFYAVGRASKTTMVIASSMSNFQNKFSHENKWNARFGKASIWLLVTSMKADVWRLAFVPNKTLRAQAQKDWVLAMNKFVGGLKGAADAAEAKNGEYSFTVEFPNFDRLANREDFES